MATPNVFIDDKIKELSAYFLSDYTKEDSQQNIGLLTGRSGTLFVQACIYNLTQDQEVLLKIRENVNCIIELIQESEIIGTQYSQGLCGFAYVLNMVLPLLEDQQEMEDLLEEIDEILVEDVDVLLQSKNFDLLHGVLGTGIYLMQRGEVLSIEKIITALDQNKIEADTEIKWSRYDPYNLHTDIIDFGLAHGNAGILYFLAKSYENGIKRETCKKLIDGNIQFFYNNIQDFDTVGSFFPAIFKCSEYETKVGVKSRLGWCYGDLTILNTFLLIAALTDNDRLKKDTIQMLIANSKRKDFKQTYIEDAGYCHGTAGLSDIYLHLYNSTGNQEFGQAAAYWMDKTLELSKQKDYIGGFLFNLGNSSFGSDITQLNGLAGVLSALIASKDANSRLELSKMFFIK